MKPCACLVVVFGALSAGFQYLQLSTMPQVNFALMLAFGISALFALCASLLFEIE